jgi:hypothetical protein
MVIIFLNFQSLEVNLTKNHWYFLDFNFSLQITFLKIIKYSLHVVEVLVLH